MDSAIVWSRSALKNRFGLDRHVPAEIARAVRQRDGFGCVVCGNAIIDYDHWDPPFANAHEHLVDGIILLCISCHGLRTRRFLSNETIEAARLRPKARIKGYSFGPFDVGSIVPRIVIGEIEATNTQIVLQYDNEKLLEIKPPEEAGGPFRLSATIKDRTSREILSIIDNEWQTPTTNWDVDVSASTISIRSALRNIDLVLRTELPHSLIFERLDMTHRGVRITSRAGYPTEIHWAPDSIVRLQSAVIDGSQCAIWFGKGNTLAIGRGGSFRAARIEMNPSDEAERIPTQSATLIPFRKPEPPKIPSEDDD